MDDLETLKALMESLSGIITSHAPVDPCYGVVNDLMGPFKSIIGGFEIRSEVSVRY